MDARARFSLQSTPRWWRRIVVNARRANVLLWIEIGAAAVFLLAVYSTWFAFTRAPEDGGLLPATQVSILLVSTLIPAMTLLVLWGRRLALRRAAGSTARLHVRLVFFFSSIAAVPTLLVAGFAAFLFQSGVDFWFSDDSRGLMENARELAEGYYEQNQLEVANETVAMAGDMRFFLERASLAEPGFADFYRYQAQARDLNESAIIQKLPDGSLRTAAVFDIRANNDPLRFSKRVLPALESGELVVVEGNAQRIEALAPIDAQSGIYLYNARTPEAESFNYWERAKSIASSYEVLTKRARALQLRFNLALFVVSLMIVGLAVWFALRLADRQVEPLTDLVQAAREVGAGNFALRVEGRTGTDEIGLLNRAFNRMTEQIEEQTGALLLANRQLEERRAFIEAVLGSVTAGVVSVDRNRRVLLMNSTAQEILLDNDAGAQGALTLAELSGAIDKLVESGSSGGVINHSKGGEHLTLAVKIVSARDGYVITFEDITRQLLDQRQAAWSDVARRIAHEIKNPLTPIQLATERLKRRYRKQINTDADLFDELTDTIVRQVGDLRKMVDEFSSFARLPKPHFRREDAIDLVRQALFLQEVSHPQIDFSLSTEAMNNGELMCDRHQFGQAMTNVLKNAVEAVEARAQSAEPDYRGKITVEMQEDDDFVTIAVEDNGIGLSLDSERVIEPYVTTREKGTGLGLAIVNKIVDEHGGDMSFSSGSGGGTRVTLRFAKDPAARAQMTAA